MCNWKEEFDCPECGMVLETSVAMKSYYDKEHRMEPVHSREVCYQWRRGNCTRVNCWFAHVGSQNKQDTPNTSSNSKRVPSCKNGVSCEWLKKVSCGYYHTRVGVQRPWVNKEKTS